MENKDDVVEKNIDNSQVDNPYRREFVMAAVCAATAGSVVAAIPFVNSLSPSKDVLAVGSVEVDLSNIKVGQAVTVMWRGQPTFIMHRSKEQIDSARSVDLSQLQDPQADEERVQKEQWLVAIGVCTHLGCVPIANKGDFGGWLCPCHGSHYDASGRIRKGPAPTNLAIPPYEFISETKIKIG